MMIKEMQERYGLYGEKVADTIREMYENDTGDKLEDKDDFTKVVEYCGCAVMLEDIPVEDAIIKQNDGYAVVFNEKVATNLKEKEIGHWNIKLMADLGRIIFNYEAWNQQATGTILYPTKYYDLNDKEKLESMVKSIINNHANEKSLAKKPKKGDK